jgi:uncharacterized iron-regulated membrane protein
MLVRPWRARAGSRRKTRWSWFALHSALGMTTGLVLFVIVLSGAIATLGDEIEWLVHPELRVSPAAERASWGEIVAAAEAAGEGYVGVSAWGPEAPYLPAQVYVQPPAGEFRKIYVDPFSGSVLGDSGYRTIQWFFRHVHMRFLLPDHGILIVGFFGMTLLVSTVTGVLTFKKWWRGAFRLRLGKGHRVFWGDFHRLSGIWSLWFLVLISVTGIWYGVEELIHDAGGTLVYPPFPEVAEVPAQAASHARVSIDVAVAAAQAALPGLETGAVRLSTQPRAPIVVHGVTGEVLVRDRANAVFVNPHDGSVMQIWSAAEAGPARRWVHTVDPLHFGSFGGLTTKLVWTFFGLLISAQILAGSWMWLRRARTEARRAGAAPGRPSSGLAQREPSAAALGSRRATGEHP